MNDSRAGVGRRHRRDGTAIRAARRTGEARCTGLQAIPPPTLHQRQARPLLGRDSSVMVRLCGDGTGSDGSLREYATTRRRHQARAPKPWSLSRSQFAAWDHRGEQSARRGRVAGVPSPSPLTALRGRVAPARGEWRRRASVSGACCEISAWRSCVGCSASDARQVGGPCHDPGRCVVTGGTVTDRAGSN
jgi:hypothetical protein